MKYAYALEGSRPTWSKFQATRIHNEILSQRNQNSTYQLPTEIVNVRDEN